MLNSVARENAESVGLSQDRVEFARRWLAAFNSWRV
jgi:hypothetical protein